MLGWLRWSSAIAEIVAGLCLAWPALRLSRHLLQIERLDARASDDDTLDSLRQRLVSASREGLARWDRTDHRLLVGGIIAFLYGALGQLLLLVLR